MPDTYTLDYNDQGKKIFIRAIDQGDGTFSWATCRGAKAMTTPDQATVSNVFTDWVGSSIDTFNLNSVSYTIKNTRANSITWQVLGANLADFSDAGAVKAARAAWRRGPRSKRRQPPASQFI